MVKNLYLLRKLWKSNFYNSNLSPLLRAGEKELFCTKERGNEKYKLLPLKKMRGYNFLVGERNGTKFIQNHS
jgi:hypothetical protein